jgi:integrase
MTRAMFPNDLVNALVGEADDVRDLAQAHAEARCGHDRLVSAPPSRRVGPNRSSKPSLHLVPLQVSSMLDTDTEKMAGRRANAPGPAQEVQAPMRDKRSSRHQGIETRHSRSCASRQGAPCSCKPAFQACAYFAREKKSVKRTFPTLSAAVAWRQDAQVAIRKGTMKTPTRMTVHEAAEEWLEGVKSGRVTNGSGHAYKPSVVRGYGDALRRRILPELGAIRLSELTRVDLQDFADGLRAEGLSPSTVRNTLMPLRAIYRRALLRGVVAVNPTLGLQLPAVSGKRERIAGPEEAARLLATLKHTDRVLWATAMYAGLRLGEIRALQWCDVDLAGGVLRVERSWDEKAREPVETKNRGKRRVPLIPELRDLLLDHKLETRRTEGLVFGVAADRPFTPSAVRRRADRAWAVAGLERITLHEARHTYGSLLIAARVNAKAISSYMGHSSIDVTFDIYGHLMPGNEEEAADLLEAYLERSRTEQARLATGVPVK